MTEKIRNFVIISHVDHGKSTLADRFLEITGTIDKRRMRPQYLDRLESERERGITIKMAPVRMVYRPAEILNSKSEILNQCLRQIYRRYDKSKIQNPRGLEIRDSDLEIESSEHILNLIDTPGHSDFSYEVSRALASVEGAVLLVDVTQGIQAQTLVNFRLAKNSNLKIIGALNKIDIAGLDPGDVKKITEEMAGLMGVEEKEIFKISGKTGEGVKELLDAIIKQIPAPRQPDARSQSKAALIFDSVYDDHKGVVAFVRNFSGAYEAGSDVKLMVVDEEFKIKEVGYFSPELKKSEKITEGEIGYIATGIKNPEKLKIGDTIGPLIGGKLLAGYREPKPVVFVSLYPDDADQYEDFKYGLMKLKLNDSSLSFEPDTNEVLGRGFKCGFLGQLHFEIAAERLEKEFNLKTVSTFPFVAYKIKNKRSEYEIIKTVEELPEDFIEILEPMIKISMISPIQYLGNVLRLKQLFRIKDVETENLENKVLISAKMPLSALLSDFDGQLKSVSQGMASFSYELGDYEKADLEKVEILVASEKVSGLSRLMYRDELEHESRKMLSKLKDILPRQQFTQSLQAKTKGRIVARENIPALKKDVTGYLYGGDRTRKMKLWKKQKKGKKKLEMMGRVTISAADFKKLLKK